MEEIRFQKAYDEVMTKHRERCGIGTLSEKTLHAILKNYFEPDKSRHEVKIGTYIADIATENGITEIQTRSFDRLRGKLSEFLEQTEVTVVYPIARTKYLRWINPETGEMTEKRKSPKTGRFCDAFGELYKIKPLLTHPRLHICLMLIDMTEYRNLNGWSKDKKKGSSRFERIPDFLADELTIHSVADYSLLIPQSLSENFTAKEYAKAAHITVKIAQKGLNILKYVGAVSHSGNRGREFEYSRQKPLS